MARNVEIKAHLRDPSTIKSRVLDIKNMGDITVIGKIIQHDIFYGAINGRLKLRMFEDKTAQIISYNRSDISGPKLSVYEKVKLQEPYPLHMALSKALGIIGEVKNERFVYTVGQTRVHIDLVEGLGNFIELEVVLDVHQTPEYGQSVAEEFMKILDIKKEDLIAVSYFDLLHPDEEDE